MGLIKIKLPLVINKNKVKWRPFYLNINNFIQVSKIPALRNALKQRYTEAIQEELQFIEPIEGPVKMIYVIHGKDGRKFDVANVGAILEKFTADALVKFGIIQDDNTDTIKRVEFIFGGVDRDDPTADLYIIPDDAGLYNYLLRHK